MQGYEGRRPIAYNLLPGASTPTHAFANSLSRTQRTSSKKGRLIVAQHRVSCRWSTPQRKSQVLAPSNTWLGSLGALLCLWTDTTDTVTHCSILQRNQLFNSNEKRLARMLPAVGELRQGKQTGTDYRQDQPGDPCGDDRNDPIRREFFHEQISRTGLHLAKLSTGRPTVALDGWPYYLDILQVEKSRDSISKRSSSFPILGSI
jgi:hypothetical protein